MPVWTAAANSLRTALLATLIAVVLGLLVSLVVSRRPRSAPARRALGVLDAVFMLPLGVSAVTVGFGFLITLNRPPLDLRSSSSWYRSPKFIVALPLVVRVLLPVLRHRSPAPGRTAQVLGAGALARARQHRRGPSPRAARASATGFAFATS